MPLYEYRCQDCDHRFEQFVTVARRDSVSCPNCSQGRVERLLSVFAAHATAPAASPPGACHRCGDPRGSCS